MSAKILVLAATGTTGSATVRALAERGVAARAATRAVGQAALPAGVEGVRFDLDDPSSWGGALAGVERLYFANAPFHPDEVARAGRFLAAAKAAGVTRVVKLSALGVDQAPESGHRRVERLIEDAGFAHVHLRPSFFMENFIHFYGQGVRSGVIGLPAGAGTTGFVAADDIGRAAAAALVGDATGEAWTLTGPESLNHDQVAATLSEVLGRRVSYADISPEAFRAGLAAAGLGEVGVATMSWLYDMVRAGWCGEVNDTVARVTGRPPIRFADWARSRAAAWA